jgi:hypothetical protein
MSAPSWMRRWMPVQAGSASSAETPLPCRRSLVGPGAEPGAAPRGERPRARRRTAVPAGHAAAPARSPRIPRRPGADSPRRRPDRPGGPRPGRQLGLRPRGGRGLRTPESHRGKPRLRHGPRARRGTRRGVDRGLPCGGCVVLRKTFPGSRPHGRGLARRPPARHCNGAPAGGGPPTLPGGGGGRRGRGHDGARRV